MANQPQSVPRGRRWSTAAPWQADTEVIATYAFEGKTNEDLSFKRRDILFIKYPTKDSNWYFARHSDGREGMIPANYVKKRCEVKLNTMPWYHGKINRDEAERLLQSKTPGLFLVRESTNYPGDYTLCVVSPERRVEFYHIKYSDNNQLTVDDEVYFENLIPLIEHYREDSDGLCCRLETPVPKRDGQLEAVVDWKSFEDSNWVLQKRDLQMETIIGRGEFGEVWRGKYRNDLTVAVKTLKETSKAAQSFLREAQVMTELQHPNLVRFLGVMKEKENIHIVTEYLVKGNLVDYLRTRGRTIITKKNQINFSCDTCRGMAYIEGKRLVHRDLAARNILIHEDDTAKVSDFGLARHVNMFQDSAKFPIKWTAPEALRSNRFTTKSDVWSFGVLLWEVYSFGRNPYPRIPQSDVTSVVEKGYRMEQPEGCPSEIFNIMSECWKLNPDERPSFKQLLTMLEQLRLQTPN